MRDLLNDGAAAAAPDPTEAARRAMRPSLRKRFYAVAGVGEHAQGFSVLLDGKPIRTPARRAFAAPTRARAAQAIPREPWRLGAAHTITTLTGSALIALAVAAGALTAETAWTAAHVDEDWNMDQWGRDEIALQRREFRFADMSAAAVVL